MLHHNLSASREMKAHSDITGNECADSALMQLPNILLYMTEVMKCTFSLQLQMVMHTHTFTGLRLKTPMRIPAEEGQLHLGFVHSLIWRPSWKQKCANHTDWPVGSAKTNTGYYNHWKDLRPLVNKQTTNAFWNNTNLKFYEKRNVMRYRTGTILNQKHAYRYGFSPNANCPVCPCTDSSHVANTLKWGTWL